LYRRIKGQYVLGPLLAKECCAAHLLCLLHLQLFSQLNVEEAARHCGMGKTKFKAIIRNFGITRWPYRWLCVPFFFVSLF
jgi:hypothetical protein